MIFFIIGILIILIVSTTTINSIGSVNEKVMTKTDAFMVIGFMIFLFVLGILAGR